MSSPVRVPAAAVVVATHNRAHLLPRLVSALAQGKTVNNPDQQFDGRFGWAPETTEERGFYETYNIAYRRDVLAQANGFDEGWRIDFPAKRSYRAPTWGEDTDLALRAKKA